MRSLSSPPVVFVRQRIEHMGSHSGYDQLVPPLAQMLRSTHSVFLEHHDQSALVHRLLSSATWRIYRTPFYNQHNLRSELRALWWKPLTRKIIHVLYSEDNLGLLARFRGRPDNRVVATVHQPLAWWQRQGTDPARLLDRLGGVIALSKSEAQAFSLATRAPVHFVPHGIDVDFFCPAEDSSVAARAANAFRRCIFVGNWLRDYRTLHDTIVLLAQRKAHIRFDLVTPEKAPRSPEDQALLAALVARADVVWHRDVDDIGLRQLYRSADLLLLPLRESTANNAVLEAMACGLPIVTNHTTGIADYTDSAYASVTAAGDAAAMADSSLRLLDDTPMRQAMARAARAAAVRVYSWQAVAASMKHIYESLA